MRSESEVSSRSASISSESLHEKRKTIYWDFKCHKIFSQSLCLQMSVLVIHWHCFQISYAGSQVSFKEQPCHHDLSLVSKHIEHRQFQSVVKHLFPLLSYSAIFTRELFEKALESMVTR